MDLAHLLLPGSVRVLSSIPSKKRLFQELGEMTAPAHSLSPAQITDALQERELLGPTGVGHGIALPHARVEGLGGIAGAFIRLEKPMDYDSVDRKPVDLIFCLLAPKEAGVEHLKALALISRTMRDSATVAKLRANTDAAKVHAILTSLRNPAAA